MMDSENSNWRTVQLGELLQRVSNGCSNKVYVENVGLPVTRIMTISDEVVDLNRVRYAVDATEKTIEKYGLKKGDILFSHINSGIHVGKTAVFEDDSEVVLHGINLLLLRVNNTILPRFLHLQMKHMRHQGFFLKIAQHSVNQASINQKALKQVEVLVPPLLEQKRIVAKIEALFAQLDEGVEKLKAAQAQLKTYRQSVLKAAFEGRLTEDFRTVNKLSKASELITDLRKSQANRYKRAVTRAKAEELRIPVKWKSYEDITEDEKDLVSELPDGWSYIRTGEVADDIFDGPFGSHLKSKDYIDEGVRVIRLENIGPVLFYDHLMSFVSEEKYRSISKHKVKAGDIIFSSFISDDIRVVILPEHIDLAINKSDCFCVRTDDTTVNKSYLTYYLSSLSTRKQLIDHIHGATRPRINTTQLKQVLVPYCDIREQNQIVQEIESRLSLADKMEESIEQALKQSETLRQSILKKAFEGRLVEMEN